jgi:hypothetical protein
MTPTVIVILTGIAPVTMIHFSMVTILWDTVLFPFADVRILTIGQVSEFARHHAPFAVKP